VDRQKAARGIDRLLMLLGEIVAERAHQLRAACPYRIRMLPLDFVEQGRGDLVLAHLQATSCRSVKCVDVAGDILGVGAGAAAASAGGEWGKQRHHQQGGERTG
jgi:hypothetical protein